MSRRGVNRRSRSGLLLSGGMLSWLLSVPARLHLRWLMILLVMAAAMAAYGRVLITAAPMPPSKPPGVRSGSPASPTYSMPPATSSPPDVH
ncbi:hypothetical protein ACIOC1_14460 [Streptomyces sp. NPDC088197]|uniref:hypothetical protein n=1 Tax=unclassified Streptomyces TaxID=2593676 RepID=UPI0036F11327